ncbi:glycosyl hydrolase [Paenibacillus chartarius]|uniref:Glycosyl hydrolase n=1 Tax=Paenibacillus chartarius TaxID=747481 RepID=A0ABV6DSK3_9BACL
MNITAFQHPEVQYRIHPFWFWNGDMDEREMERQIEEMAAQGVGGFFLCARQGMKVSYLSQSWFDKVKFAIEAAKKRGMHVWLYDEYPYPSGIAGGEVTLLHPEAKHQTLEVTQRKAGGGEQVSLELPWARVLHAKAVPVTAAGQKLWDRAVDLQASIGNYQADPVFQKTGLTTYNQKRFFTYRTIFRLDWTAPELETGSEWEVAVYQEKEIEDFKYYGTFVDPCHREAMQTFIRLTHERYEQAVGDEFGATVKGMFTDEIGLLGTNPWSPQLPARFLERNGYSLIDRLPALHNADYPDAAKIRYDYYQTLHEMLCESYHEPVHDWCDERGLEYVAEVPSIRMTTQRYSHIPGGDSAHEKLGRPLDWILRRYALSFRDNPKMTSSIARQLGRERCLNESFHSVGWSMNLQDAKWMIDRMAALGINFQNFHAFFYTIDGMTQHDAPPSQFYQNPYWPHFRQLGDYTGRICYMMSQGVADIRIAMLDPTTTLWAHMANPLHHFDYCGRDPQEKEKLQQLKSDWQSLHVHLLKDRRDFDHLDPELLAEAVVLDGTLRIGKAVYSVLILPPVSNLEQKAWMKIQEFLNGGGKVIGFGLLPYQAIDAEGAAHREALETFGLGQDTQSTYWNGETAQSERETLIAKGDKEAHFITRLGGQPVEPALNELSALLNRLLPRTVKLESSSGAEAQPVFLKQDRRMSEYEYIVFVTNQEGASHELQLRIDPSLIGPEWADAAITVDRLDIETGAEQPLHAEQSDDGSLIVPLTFAPYASHTVRLTRGGEARKAAEPKALWRWSLPAEADWKLKALQPNALRIDRFQLKVGDVPAVLVQAKSFIDQCADIGEQHALPVSFSQVFGVPKKTALAYPLQAEYTVRFFVEHVPAGCSLLMDETAISGEFTLTLNGTDFHRGDFRKQLVYDYANTMCGIQHALVQGWNELTVRIDIEHDWDGIVDAIYLYGDFGASFDEQGCAVVTAPPQSAATLTEPRYYEGYPHYAGTLSFTSSFALEGLPNNDAFELGFDGWDVHDLVEVLVNGQPLGIRPWSPYVWTGPVSLLKEGGNEVEVRVTGTLIGLLEGKYFDYREHRVIDI